MIEDANMVHSMLRVGRCIDNGLIETFWRTLKTENIISISRKTKRPEFFGIQGSSRIKLFSL